MAEEDEAQEGEVTESTASNEAEGNEGATDNEAVETEARTMGWVPKDEWRGDPDMWRDAGEFVQRGKEILPIVRSQLERANKKIEELENKFAESTEALRRVDRMSAKALERQKAQLTAEFEARKEKAVETGDKDEYRQIVKAEADALKSLDDDAKEATKEAEKKDDKSGLTPREKAAVDEWVSENPWFTSSRRMRAAADDYFDEVAEDMPGLSIAERLAEVKKRVMDEFPAKFGKKSNGTQPRTVESGARVAGEVPGVAGKLSAKLPKDVRAIADRDVKAGLYKSVEDWAEVYFESEG